MWPIATDGVAWSVDHYRELCKSGWIDWDAILDVDSGGCKEAFLRWGSKCSTSEGVILRVKMGPAQDMPGHVQQSIYSKQLSRGQHCYGADAD